MIADLLLSGFVRAERIRRSPNTPLAVNEALDAAEAIRRRPNCVTVMPSKRHWALRRICAAGPVANATLSTTHFSPPPVLDSGSELPIADRGFARYPALRWRHLLDADHEDARACMADARAAEEKR